MIERGRGGGLGGLAQGLGIGGRGGGAGNQARKDTHLTFAIDVGSGQIFGEMGLQGIRLNFLCQITFFEQFRTFCGALGGSSPGGEGGRSGKQAPRPPLPTPMDHGPCLGQDCWLDARNPSHRGIVSWYAITSPSAKRLEII